MFSPQQILPLFISLKAQRLWLGFSGGLDSQVLLSALSELCQSAEFPFTRAQLHAVHINHGWSADAEAWEELCRQRCAALAIDYRAIRVNAKPAAGESPEACARAARYTAFAGLMKADDVLLTAHQQDDQAETLLLQLLRGAGVKGLASMPQLAPFAQGQHLRPLLNIPRTDLLAYAKLKGLDWIEDASNANSRYARNFLRHHIVPALKARWPDADADANIARSARHCAEAADLLDELASEDLKKVQGEYPNTLSRSQLLKLSASRQKNVLRYWFAQAELLLPNTAQLQRIMQDLLHCRADATPAINLQDRILRCYQDHLFLLDTAIRHDASCVYSWGDFTEPLALPALGVLTATLTYGQGIRADLIQNNMMTIRFRQTGERCQPAGRTGSHPLKKLFQEWRIPPWQREQVPLLYCADQLVAVIGHCICADFLAREGEPGWYIELTPPK